VAFCRRALALRPSYINVLVANKPLLGFVSQKR